MLDAFKKIHTVLCYLSNNVAVAVASEHFEYQSEIKRRDLHALAW